MTTTNIVRKPSGVIDFDAYKGLEGSIGLTGMTFTVKVIDARQSFGRLDLCVEPLHGEGSRWMEYRKVELKSEPVRSEITTTEVTTVREQVAQRAIEASRENGSSNTDLIQQLLNQINNGNIATQTKETIK
jgi:hypothetical protein